MSFSVALWGRLELPEKSLPAWRSARVDAARYEDWTGDFAAPFPRAATTVAKHLARWADDSLAYRMKGATVTVRGILDEDTYRDACAEVATAFRAAAEHGGKGELVFFGLGEDISCVVRVEDGSSSFRDVPERPEWRETIDTLIGGAQQRFEDTPIGKAKRKADDAAIAEGAALRASTNTTDDAIDALFRSLEPKGDFYNPMMEPSKSAMERLRNIDARVAARATTRLEASWKNASVHNGAYCMHLITLIAHYRHRDARGLLATIHATKSARFDVKTVAARALLAVATDAEIRAIFRASRETMVARWAKPNAKIDSVVLKKLAKAER